MPWPYSKKESEVAYRDETLNSKKILKFQYSTHRISDFKKQVFNATI